MANFKERLKAAAWRIGGAASPSSAAWTGSANSLLVFWTLMVLAFAWFGVLPHFSVEKLLGLLVFFGILGAFGAGIFLIVWLAALLKPAYRFALFLVLPPTALFAAITWSAGAMIAVPLFLIALSLFAGALASLRAGAPRRLGLIIAASCGAVGLLICLYGLLAPTPDRNPALRNYRLSGPTPTMPNPGEPGVHKVSTFTYGEGKDRHRPEYARAASIITKTVDGSRLDKQWTGVGGWLRTLYWGFDAAHMPLQGRVWMPEGAGPFPLVLIVHGNHGMEEYSDPGYAYLGELLASQGFILASVDENFLNSSLADFVNPFRLRMGSENDARAWLLLEHLAQWRAWAGDPNNPLHAKIDMTRIALIGHSRGGEAVAIANAFNDLNYFPDDATIPFDFHFQLRGIAAIAPVDGQYNPRDWPTPMRDQNYFVMQGNMDGDLISFMGSSQYSRASFSGKTDAFKASLYVAGANHGQFNTQWGRNDFGLPYKFLIDERPIMKAGAQRAIAKVYLSAFLQMTLNGKAGYRPLFEDARNGASWLPDDYLVANYADARTRWLANYEEDLDPGTGSDPRVTITGPNLTVWREEFAKLKYTRLGAPVALLAWDNRVHKAGAAYVFHFKDPPAISGASEFVFSASQARINTLPEGWRIKGPRRDQDSAPLDWTIALTDAKGHEALLPLSHDQALYPQIKSETRRAGAIDRIASSEIVMRRFRFDLKDFRATGDKVDLNQLKEIRFAFDRSPRGAVALSDIGLVEP